MARMSEELYFKLYFNFISLILNNNMCLVTNLLGSADIGST